MDLLTGTLCVSHIRHWIFFHRLSRLLRCASCRALRIWTSRHSSGCFLRWGQQCMLQGSIERSSSTKFHRGFPLAVHINTSVKPYFVPCVGSASFDRFVLLPILSADLRCFLDSFGRSHPHCHCPLPHVSASDAGQPLPTVPLTSQRRIRMRRLVPMNSCSHWEDVSIGSR